METTSNKAEFPSEGRRDPRSLGVASAVEYHPKKVIFNQDVSGQPHPKSPVVTELLGNPVAPEKEERPKIRMDWTRVSNPSEVF
jgi:hypothetical protein